jgi:hypothetical protein
VNWLLSLFRPNPFRRRIPRIEPLDPREERLLDELRQRRAAQSARAQGNPDG